MLHGTTGYQQLLVNAQGRRVERVGVTAPDLRAQGADRGQGSVPDDRRTSYSRWRRRRSARSERRVVAIDPSNGDVLAFVSTPTFDPNGFARGLTVPEYRALAENIDTAAVSTARCAASTRRARRSSRSWRSRRCSTASWPPRPRATAAATGSSRAPATGTATGRSGGHGTVNMHTRDRAVLRHLFLRRFRTRSASTACTTS